MAGGGSKSLMEGIDVDQPERAGSRVSKQTVLSIVTVVALLGALVIFAWQIFGGQPDAGAASRVRVAIDAETGEVLERYRVADGIEWPWPHPKTGRATVYPAEKCHWTSAGEFKIDPTYVLVQSYLGSREKTYCPDCGREVVPHNPMPPDDVVERALGE